MKIAEAGKAEEAKAGMSKIAKGCLGCLGAAVLIPVSLIAYHFGVSVLHGLIYFRPSFYGKVVDRETQKPVPYAMLSLTWLSTNVGVKGHGRDVVVADNAGGFKFNSDFVKGGPQPSWIGDWGANSGDAYQDKRMGQRLTVWFPGYKKVVLGTEGRKLLKGNVNISLERPQTAEEAVGALDNAGAGKGNLYIIYEKAKLKESARIIKKYQGTKWADKVYMNFFAGVEEKLTNDIRNYYLSFSCENLVRNKNLCLSDREKWLNL